MSVGSINNSNSTDMDRQSVTGLSTERNNFARVAEPWTHLDMIGPTERVTETASVWCNTVQQHTYSRPVTVSMKLI
jgi:hypothetical protein